MPRAEAKAAIMDRINAESNPVMAHLFAGQTTESGGVNDYGFVHCG